jgi:hypothetical protein
MRDSAVMYRRQVATLKQQGRQYHVAMQELQVRYNEANSLLSESKRDLEIYRTGGNPSPTTHVAAPAVFTTATL